MSGEKPEFTFTRRNATSSKRPVDLEDFKPATDLGATEDFEEMPDNFRKDRRGALVATEELEAKLKQIPTPIGEADRRGSEHSIDSVTSTDSTPC